MKTPTLKEKVKMYEDFLHNLDMLCGCKPDLVGFLLENASSWSYAHRVGEGMSEKDRQKLINTKFWKLNDYKKEI